MKNINRFYYTAALHAFYKVVLLLLLVHAGSCERVPSQENSWQWYGGNKYTANVLRCLKARGGRR